MPTIDKYKLKIEVDGEEQIIDLRDNLESISNKFAGVATAGLAAFSALAVSAVKMADSMADAADAIGISAARLYQLNVALEQSGGNFGDAQSMLRGFSQSLGDVEKGSQETIDALYKLGLSRDQIENLSDDQLYQAVINGLGGMEAGFERNRLGMVLMGKAADGIDWAKMAAGSQKAIDPEMEARLQAASKAADELAQMYRDLEMAALTAIGPIIEKISELNFNSEDAKKAIQILGAVIAAAFAAAVVTRVVAIVDAMKKFAAATRAAATAQAFMVGLTGVGLATIAASALAATGAYLALGKAMEDTADIGDLEEVKVTGKRSASGAGRTIGQTPQEKEAEAARRTTQELRRQLQAQNDYKELVNSTIGMREEERVLILETADIVKKYREDLAKVENKIQEEKDKGVKANQATIAALEEQKTILQEQLPVSISLAVNEKDRTQSAKETLQIFQNFAKYQGDFNKLLANDVALHQLQLLLVGETGSRAKYLSDQYNIMGQGLNRIVDLANQISTIDQDLTPDQSKKLYEDILTFSQKNRENQDQLNQSQSRMTDLAATYVDILDQIPANKRKEVEGLLQLIDLENRRNILLLKNLDEIKKAQEEVQRSYEKGFESVFENLAKSVSPFEVAVSSVNSVLSNLDNALTNFVKNGKFSFKDFTQSILRDMALIIARAIIMRTILAIVGIFSPTAAASLSTMVTGRAKGGPVLPGKPYLIGEKGPELAIFDRPGTIIPNNQLAMAGGGSTTVNYNINAVDAASFRSLVARDPQFIYSVTEVGRRSSPSRRLA